MSDDLLKKIVTIVVDKLDVEENKVTVDAQFIDDLGADSLDTVELIMEIEEQFEIDIPDEDAEKIQSVKDALDYIKRISEIGK
tara:strand:- start:582 stop:830 length:249 start_codon:yes stop_codon:yes gene_type:complete